jgi:hypothetical protein
MSARLAELHVLAKTPLIGSFSGAGAGLWCEGDKQRKGTLRLGDAGSKQDLTERSLITP